MSLTALLEQTAWIRALARTLASDAHLADDLVQHVWLTAIERPPKTGRPVRGWLATVLRHRLRDVAREHARRGERERRAAESEALPSSHDVVEKAATQRALVEAVLELDEPYRTTVLLRFFEELPQREIARRMQTTTATVNSRLTRALEKLRERLSRAGGSRSWLQVLVPLLREPSMVPAAALGVSSMKIVASVLVIASVLVGIALWRAPIEGARVGAEDAALASAEPQEVNPGEAAPSLADPKVASSARVAAAVEPAAPRVADIPATTVTARIVRGRVLNAEGNGVSGVALGLASGSKTEALPAEAKCTSGPGGWFELALDSAAERIVAADARFETVLAGFARVAERTEPTVVIAERIRVAGSVVDEHGAALAGAWVALRLPPNFGADWELVLDYSMPSRWVARTGADGRFALDGAPAIRGATLSASLGGFAPRTEPAPERTEERLTIVLERPLATTGLVRGVVLDAAGSAVEGAYVSAGAQSSHTDRDGEFTLDVSLEHTRPRIYAALHGYLPAMLEPETGADGAVIWPEYAVLQLGSAPGVARGRVIDHAGRAIAGAKVWIDDPTYFGEVAELHVATETILHGSEAFWSFETTRSDGSFEIAGLFLDRSYRLEAIDPRTLVSQESGPVHAGDQHVEIKLPTDEVHERIAGRVLTKRGEPLAGIRVQLSRVTYEMEHGDGVDNEGEGSVPVLTDRDGAFAFTSVPKTGVYVIASGDTIFSEGLWLEEERDLLHLEMRPSRRFHVQVELDPPVDRADQVAILDAAGRQSYASVFRGGGSHMATLFDVTAGRSEVLSVAEGAEMVVLYLGGEEVARIPFHATADEIQVVRY